MVSIFSLIDLASIIPFYIDLGLQGNQLSSTTFIRLLRLLRMMKANGRFVEVGGPMRILAWLTSRQ